MLSSHAHWRGLCAVMASHQPARAGNAVHLVASADSVSFETRLSLASRTAIAPGRGGRKTTPEADAAPPHARCLQSCPLREPSCSSRGRTARWHRRCDKASSRSACRALKVAYAHPSHARQRNAHWRMVRSPRAGPAAPKPDSFAHPVLSALDLPQSPVKTLPMPSRSAAPREGGERALASGYNMVAA